MDRSSLRHSPLLFILNIYSDVGLTMGVATSLGILSTTLSMYPVIDILTVHFSVKYMYMTRYVCLFTLFNVIGTHIDSSYVLIFVTSPV